MSDMTALKGKSVAVVGAGVSGLAAAYRLQQAGATVTVFEKSHYVGGRTHSLRREGFIIDVGALLMMPTYENVKALAQELGIAQHLITTRPTLAIAREGKLHHIDFEHPLRSLFGLRLISLRSALKLVKLLPLILRNWSRFNYENMGDMAPFDNETIHDFCMREFNEEIDTWLASPLIRAGSLTGTREAPFGDWLWQTVGFRYPRMMQWDTGMDFFAQSLARGLEIKLNTSITEIRNDAGKATLTVSGSDTTYDACVVAVPAPVACAIAPSVTPQQKEFFGTVRPVPMISAHLGLRRAPGGKDAVILIPEKESADLLMILLDHNKVAGRAPEGKGIVTIWSTKEWTAAHVGDSDEQVIAELCRLAMPFVGRIDDMIEISHVERSDFVVAQTYPGFFTRLRDYMATRDLNQPLFFSGDFSAEGIEGATICGLNAARHVEQYLTA